MIEVKNGLPVAVHNVSGGCARMRVGGFPVPLNNVESGTIEVAGGTQIRLLLSARSTGCILAIGFSSGVSYTNAAWICIDMETVTLDVPEGTVIHFTCIDQSTLIATEGGASDMLFVSIYG